MPTNDNKKVQTLINICADQMVTIRNAVATMDNMKTIFQTINPDVTDTPLEGNLSAFNNAFTALKTETDKAIWTALINAKVESHRNQALS